MRPEFREPWRSFLHDVDARLHGPIELHCLGGFVVTVLHGLPRPTADIDVLSVVPGAALGGLIELAGEDLASLVSSPDWVRWIAEHGDLFHMAFMPARDFGRFARERDIQVEDDHIGQLWTLCLLEGDGVWSRRRSARRGLELR